MKEKSSLLDGSAYSWACWCPILACGQLHLCALRHQMSLHTLCTFWKLVFQMRMVFQLAFCSLQWGIVLRWPGNVGPSHSSGRLSQRRLCSSQAFTVLMSMIKIHVPASRFDSKLVPRSNWVDLQLPWRSCKPLQLLAVEPYIIYHLRTVPTG